MTWLLDGNVLVALTLDDHPFHGRSRKWFLGLAPGNRIATCPVTEGTLLRLHMRFGPDGSAELAWAALASIKAHPRHVPWHENFSYSEVPRDRLTKGTQITDAWLAELARRQGGKVATLDVEFAILHGDVAQLVPVL